MLACCLIKTLSGKPSGTKPDEGKRVQHILLTLVVGYISEPEAMWSVGLEIDSEPRLNVEMMKPAWFWPSDLNWIGPALS